MPKLIDSEITRIDAKAKEISTAYSLFLFKQRKFKVLSNESKFFEALLVILIRIVVEKCFENEDREHLTKCKLNGIQKSIDCFELTLSTPSVAGRVTYKQPRTTLLKSRNSHKLISAYFDVRFTPKVRR
jgi:hypothetical protein